MPVTSRPAGRVISYPTGGPSGPLFPNPADPAYAWLAEGPTGCQKILDHIASGDWDLKQAQDPATVSLYKGAASACLSKWNDAVAVYQSLNANDFQSSTPDVVCAPDSTCEKCRELAFAWLRTAVEAYQSNPQSPPTFAPSTAPSLCPATP